jgi:hypothetical protein
MDQSPPLKPISLEGIPAALEKAHRYRMLNQPQQAESICLDVLAAEPGNQQAVATLLLALTDQFSRALQPAFDRAMGLVERLTDAYERAYFEGLVCERRGKAHFRSGSPMAGGMAHAWVERAMRLFETAETLRPAGDDDAVLRWNSCARLLHAHPEIRPIPADDREPMLE